MNSKRMFFVMIGVTFLVVCLGVGSVIVGNMMLQKQSDKLVSLKLDNAVLDQQQSAVVQAKKDIQKYTPLGVIAKSIVPQDKDQAKTVREIINLANQTGISISGISFPTSTLGQSAVVVAPSASGGTATPPAGTTTPSITQVQPVKDIPGVDQLQITVQSDNSHPSPYSQLIAFLSALEQSRRTGNVSQLTITPDGKNINYVSFQLVINVYIKP